MPERNILILENEGGAWGPFLQKYFSDILVTVHTCRKGPEAAQALAHLSPQMIFAESSFLSMPFIQKIKVQKQTNPKFRIYSIGTLEAGKRDPVFDAVFPAQPVLTDFTKKWVETLPMPETARLLVIDDEEEIVGMVQDYFEGRKAPAFDVFSAPDGKKGLEACLNKKPDLVILDIKMPVMDGREFFIELQRRKIEIPVVIFFDSISGEELNEIRKYGNPPVIEKGTVASSLPFLMQLVKKILYFRPEARD